MVEIACEIDRRFRPSRLEETDRKTYSVETVERLSATVPGSEIYFIIGADAFAEIRDWKRWKDLARLVVFAVIDRPGASYEIPAEARVKTVTGIDLPVSASAIRSRLVKGTGNLEIPPRVLAYIREHHLYGAGGAG